MHSYVSRCISRGSSFSVLKLDFESFCFKQNIRETVAFADWIMYGLISKFRQNLPSNSWREFSIPFLPEIEKKNHHLLRENSSKTTGNGCTTVWDCHWEVSQLIDEKPTEDSKYMGTVSDLGSPWDAKFWENTLGKYHLFTLFLCPYWCICCWLLSETRDCSCMDLCFQ